MKVGHVTCIHLFDRLTYILPAAASDVIMHDEGEEGDEEKEEEDVMEEGWIRA